jgi:hypothetical protein
LAGGVALDCGDACATLCDRSHSNVQAFFVFSQLLQGANGPKTSTKINYTCATH